MMGGSCVSGGGSGSTVTVTVWLSSSFGFLAVRVYVVVSVGLTVVLPPFGSAFDPARVGDPSTFEDPLHYSRGIPYVMVNGQLVVDGGVITKARPGRILRGPGYAGAR